MPIHISMPSFGIWMAQRLYNNKSLISNTISTVTSSVVDGGGWVALVVLDAIVVFIVVELGVVLIVVSSSDSLLDESPQT
jgi:hypothetical protein